MEFSFIEALGAIVFVLVLVALLAQVPVLVWVFAVPILAIIGLFNNYAK